jgi:hypothetical protein
MSILLPEQFQINDVNYVMMPHGVDDGLEVVDVLIEMGLAPMLVALVGGGEDGLDPANIDASALVTGLKSAGGIRRLAPMVLKHTMREGTKLNKAGIETAYIGNYGELSKAVWEVINRNHFFDLVLGFFGDGTD